MKSLNQRKPDWHRVNYFRTVGRVELDNWTGHKFTDMFTLLKTASGRSSAKSSTSIHEA